VVGIPGRIIAPKSNQPISPLEHGKLPDIEAGVIRSLLSRIEQLEQQVQTLTNHHQDDQSS
jgi:serine O-acetyltransferase